MIASSMVAEPSPETLESFYARHARVVWAYARTLASPRDLAEDLAAEAFLALARRVKEKGVPPDPLGYLLTTVRSRAIDHVRRRRGATLFDRFLPSPEAPADRAVEGSERRERVLSAVASLEAPLGEAVALRIFAGLTFEEAARVAGVPRGTMESRYALALEKLSFLLKEEKP